MAISCIGWIGAAVAIVFLVASFVIPSVVVVPLSQLRSECGVAGVDGRMVCHLIRYGVDPLYSYDYYAILARKRLEILRWEGGEGDAALTLAELLSPGPDSSWTFLGIQYGSAGIGSTDEHWVLILPRWLTFSCPIALAILGITSRKAIRQFSTVSAFNVSKVRDKENDPARQ